MKNKQCSATKFSQQQWDMVLLVLLLLLPIAMYSAFINGQNLIALVSLSIMCVVMLVLLIRR